MIQTRDYQDQAQIQAHNHLYDRGYGGTVMHLFTGAGKTLTAASYIHRFYDLNIHRILYVVHRLDLIVQPYFAFQRYYPEWATEKYTMFSRPALGMVTGAHNTPDARIVFGTPQTLSSREGTTSRLDQILEYGDIDLIIFDECHYAVAQSYMNLVRRLNKAKRLGLTATPMRSDGLALRQPLGDGLGFLFDSICIQRNIRWGIDNGYLCPIQPPLLIETNIAPPNLRGTMEERARSIDVSNWSDLIVQSYLEHGDNRIFAYFLPSVEHSRKAYEAFNEAGIVTFHVDGEELWLPDGQHLRGKAAKDARPETYDKLNKGQYQGGVNHAVLEIGWDCPNVTLVGLARPTDDPALLTQIIGRGTRLKEAWNPHQDLLVMDYALKGVSLMLSGSLTGYTWDEKNHEMIKDEEAEVEDLTDGLDIRDLKSDNELIDGNGVITRIGNLFKSMSEAWHNGNWLMSLSLSESAMVAVTKPNYTASTKINQGLQNGENFLIENPDHVEARSFYQALAAAYSLTSKYVLWLIRKTGFRWQAEKVAEADSAELVFDYASPLIAEYEDVKLSKKQRDWRKRSASEAQIKELKRLRALPKSLDDAVNLSKGEASRVIAHTISMDAVARECKETMRKAGKYASEDIYEKTFD